MVRTSVKAAAMAFEPADKPYRRAMEKVIGSTAMQHGDLDEKAIRLLDYLQQHGGRACEAVLHLERSLQGRKRQDVANWHAYIYTLLRGFDEEAYREMKATEGRRGRRASGAAEQVRAPAPAQPVFSMNPKANEFVPGRVWSPPPSHPPVLATAPPKAAAPAPRTQAVAPRSSGRYSAPQVPTLEVTPERTPEAVEDSPKKRSCSGRELETVMVPMMEAFEEQEAAKAGPLDRKGFAGIVSDPKVRKVSLHAVGGALALGTGGGAGGLAAGGVLGGACGLLAAPLTLGISVPIGAVLGAGAGLCTGAVLGSTSGLVAGGMLGYWRVLRAAPAA